MIAMSEKQRMKKLNDFKVTKGNGDTCNMSGHDTMISIACPRACMRYCSCQKKPKTSSTRGYHKVTRSRHMYRYLILLSSKHAAKSRV